MSISTTRNASSVGDPLSIQKVSKPMAYLCTDVECSYNCRPLYGMLGNSARHHQQPGLAEAKTRGKIGSSSSGLLHMHWVSAQRTHPMRIPRLPVAVRSEEGRGAYGLRSALRRHDGRTRTRHGREAGPSLVGRTDTFSLWFICTGSWIGYMRPAR